MYIFFAKFIDNEYIRPYRTMFVHFFASDPPCGSFTIIIIIIDSLKKPG